MTFTPFFALLLLLRGTLPAPSVQVNHLEITDSKSQVSFGGCVLSVDRNKRQWHFVQLLKLTL